MATGVRSFARSAGIHGYTWAVTLGGLDRRLLRRLGRSGGILVLNLHNVGTPASRFSRPIPPDVFDELVGWRSRDSRLTTSRWYRSCATSSARGLHSYEHDSMEYETDEYFAGGLRRCQDWYGTHLGDARAGVYAFPNGSCRDSQIAIATEAGISDVLLVRESTSKLGARVHPRVTADGVTLRELRMRVARAA